MRKALTLTAVIGLASGIVFGLPEGAAKKPAYDIKEVMKAAHKDGLLKKVTDGHADKKEKEKLLELYTALWDNTPAHGEKGSWTEKTGALVVAAAKVVLGQDGAMDALKAASNCKACHDVHKKK
jgi:hypothetical protein